MNTYQKITAARKLLDLPERATMQEIKSSYRGLVRRWHPDKCGESSEHCAEMTRRINAAYAVIMDYCSQYRFSFAEEEVKNYLSEEEWWFERFGNDPVWGGKKTSE